MTPDLVAALLDVPKIATAVACFLGLAETVDKKLQKLCSTPYNSATRFLRVALSSDAQLDHLLREAQRSFTDALTLETGSRLATAYLGLAFCQSHLGDRRNAITTLSELVALPLCSRHRRIIATTAKLASRALFWHVLFMPLPGDLTGLALREYIEKSLDRMTGLSTI